MSFVAIFDSKRTVFQEMAIVIVSSCLIALLGQFNIPLPFTPVPITFRLQTIFFLAALLGSRTAVLATALFLVQGMMGLPVFSGASALMGPLAGYYIGYLIAAFTVGSLIENGSFSVRRSAFAFLCGTLLVYICGSLYLSFFIGLQKAILLGVLPFLVGDALKTILAIKLLARCNK